MYEYAWEPNGFGIVKIPDLEGSDVQELPEFRKFASALSAHPAPSGDGGFTSTANSVACPTKDSDWLIDSTHLPSLPDEAKVVSS